MQHKRQEIATLKFIIAILHKAYKEDEVKYQEIHNCFRDQILNIFSDNVIVWSQKQLCYCYVNSFCLWIALWWPQDRRWLQKPKHNMKFTPKEHIDKADDKKQVTHIYLSQMDHREWLLHTVNWFSMWFTSYILLHNRMAITSTKNGWDTPTWSTSVSWKNTQGLIEANISK